MNKPKRLITTALLLLVCAMLACGGGTDGVVKWLNPDKHATCEKVWVCNSVTCWEDCTN
jgi:hypothetical protein